MRYFSTEFIDDCIDPMVVTLYSEMLDTPVESIYMMLTQPLDYLYDDDLWPVIMQAENAHWNKIANTDWSNDNG